MRIHLPTALVAAASALLLLLGPVGPAAWGAPEDAVVAVRTLDLSRAAGTLASLDEKSLSIRTEGATAPRSFALGEVIHLRFPDRPVAQAKPGRFRAYLVGGEVLVGQLVAPAEGGLVLDVAGLGRLELLFEHILTLERFPPSAGPCHDLASEHPRPATGDAAYDTGDDEYRGTVLEATKENLVLESKRGRKRKIAWAKVRLLHLENDELKAPTGVTAEVELANGSRLAVAKLMLAGTGLSFRLRSLPKKALTAPFDAVRVVRWKGGRFDYASDTPHEAVHRAHDEPLDSTDELVSRFGKRWWGTRIDRRADGCPLRVHGQTFRHGFGVNSHSIITIPLGGRYESFRSNFGIDDSVLTAEGAGKLKGDVDARILADGKVVWEAKGVRGGEKPRRIGPLDVKGVKQLVLEVGFGKELYSLDRANWGDPILVKKSK